MRALAAVLGCLLAASCSKGRPTLSILASSENQALDGIIRGFASAKRARINVEYRGSIEIMLELSADRPSYDVVWPANSLWLQLGDVKKRVKGVETIMSSPVVFGVRSSLADEFGWKGKRVLVRDIMDKIRAGKLRFMMASASQSNSGAGAYLGFLYALAGNPVVLGREHLADPALRRGISAILGGVDRSSGNSQWLTGLFLKGGADCMVNYESSIIEANLALEKSGGEPLYMVYPADGMSVADYPMGFIDTSSGKEPELAARRMALFTELKAYLKGAESRAALEALGRRAGLGGVALNPDPRVFRADWGARPDVSVSSVPLPSRDVILEALGLYQTEFRRPAMTVYALDFSGSMYGDGEKALKEAISLVLDPDRASAFLLQPGSRDITHVIAFSDVVRATWELRGNDPEESKALLEEIRAFEPGGGTDIHGPVIMGLKMMGAEPGRSEYSQAIILMTDGEDNSDPGFAELSAAWAADGSGVPVFGITFGKAKEDQLKEIADATKARVFDGRKDLAGSFRTAKGYN
jgi:Ca-activated chloride channel family protein